MLCSIYLLDDSRRLSLFDVRLEERVAIKKALYRTTGKVAATLALELNWSANGHGIDQGTGKKEEGSGRWAVDTGSPIFGMDDFFCSDNCHNVTD
jgi:hypothetical protein